jgi:putative MATE family efflux protein
MEQEISMMSGNEPQFKKMTRTPIPRLIFTLAVPTIMSMLISAIYNTADTFFVSRLGTSASGAVGIVFSLMAIFQAIGFTLGNGAGSLISRKLGARDIVTAGRYASTSFFAAIGVGSVFCVLGLLFIDKLMLALGSTPTILPFSRSYARYILLGAPIMCTSFVMNNILRSEGRAAFAMVGLVSGGVLNIILDPIFIFSMGLGISGAAIATLISQCVSFCLLYSFFHRRKSVMHISVSNISKIARDYVQILSLGCPSLCRQGLASIATVALNVSAAAYGDAAVAAMSIVGRIFMFILSMILGIGQGFVPVAGYNYGAKKYIRVKQAYWFTVKAGLCVSGLMALAGMIFAPNLMAVFLKDRDAIRIGTVAIRMQCVALLLHPMFVYTNMLMQATGHAISSTFLACNRQGIYFLPLIMTLPDMFGLTGIQMTQPVADILSFFTCLPFLYVFMTKLNERIKFLT